MAVANHELILQNHKFRELVKARSSFAWTLSAAMLAIYFGFILLVAFGHDLLATKVFGGVTSLGILIGLGVIFSAFVLTAIYVQRANSRFDALTSELKRELTR